MYILLESSSNNNVSYFQLTFADLTFLDVYEMLTSTLKITFDGCPELKGHFEKIANIPNIKKWLGSRPVTQH